jgi:hypothetical protein
MSGNTTILGENTLPDPNDPFSGVTTSVIGNKKALDVTSSSAALATRVDEATATITYVGRAKIGSLPSDAVWQIQRITISGTQTIIEWASGNSSFDKIWNNRSSLSYS